MLLPFTKMHGLGNDFVVFDGVSRPVELASEQVRAISERRFGIGCDQVLVLQPGRTPGTDFHFRIYNADGGEVEQCGNGARCLARFIHDAGLAEKNAFTLESAGASIRLTLEADGEVTADMGRPQFEPGRVPFAAEKRALVYDLELNRARVQVSVLALGNPHAVQIVEDVDRAPVAEQGPLIERHPRFPRGVNAGFMQIVDSRHARLRVHERGVGETLACGSGACAAVVAGRLRGLLDEQVTVELPGGRLRIRWAGEGQSVSMTGPAVKTFDGSIELA